MNTRVWTAANRWPENLAVPVLPTGVFIDDGEGGEVELMQPPINFGPPAREFPGDDETPPSGRCYTEEGRLKEVQLDWLAAQDNINITRAGTFTGDTYPFPIEEI